MRRAWREFFQLPLEEKNKYANSPKTYEGFGSRLGVDKDIVLDWADYFFLNLLPHSIKSPDKYWPSQPSALREITEEYANELFKLCEVLLRLLSTGLGLDEGHLSRAYGGDDRISACMRVNLYPRCPQPDLTLGLSPHSDPGGLTVLLADDHVDGLQVRKGDKWIAVRPEPGAFVVNVADQTQVISNAIYKSVEHRVTANSKEGRLSFAFFYNPDGDVSIGPAEELVVPSQRPAIYPTITFNEYRKYVRTRGPRGKSQVEFLKVN
ncbi:protein SRG1-like isoform X2 [Canna indica]|uniref:Protein SRG1-like isoform X2 n=1 Tax=Canna indica TaxID=4628 RepID=A0AAQ3L1S2_9LILI|nr:protein SRG1-like isoform X2 [Canna indica]